MRSAYVVMLQRFMQGLDYLYIQMDTSRGCVVPGVCGGKDPRMLPVAGFYIGDSDGKVYVTLRDGRSFLAETMEMNLMAHAWSESLVKTV